MRPYELTDNIITANHSQSPLHPSICPILLQHPVALPLSFECDQQRRITTMKNYSCLRPLDSPNQQPPLIPKDSPLRPTLHLQLPEGQSCQRGRPSASGASQHEKEQDSTQVLLTERTAGTTDNVPARETQKSNIKTYLRIRPCTTPTALLHLHPPHTVLHERNIYKFDSIFDATASQQRVFLEAGQEAASTFLEGYNATIFAYGRTGSGKTYTMFGNDDGLAPSVVKEIFARVEAGAKLSCSMIEIYRESLIDLLAVGGPELKIKDSGNSSCVVQNLSSHPIASEAEALSLIKRGNILKKIRETDLNECSSRSHVVFTLLLERVDAEGRRMECRFNLVDLAGSEKVGKSKVQGQGLQQAKKINLSLSCLGNTISALVRGSDHVPFRQSKLTRILKESLVGSSLTRIIVTCSLADEALEDTLSSMKFAQRAQKVQTQAEIAYSRGKGDREDRLRCLQAAIDRLEADTAKISLLLTRQPCECGNCLQIKAIVGKKPALPIFSFSPAPLPPYRSPKQSDKAYFSNASLEKGKSCSFLKTNYLSWPDDQQLLNRKLADLRAENERLREDKVRLEVKVRSLQERTAEKDTKDKGKKVIRLGERTSKASKENNKQNQMCMANGADRSNKREPFLSLPLSLPLESEASCLKEHDCQQILHLIEAALSKLEAACVEYRSTLYPIHLDILNQQIALLLSPSSSSLEQPFKISTLLIGLQKKMCSYVDSVGDIVPRLIEGSRCEGRQEMSELLREKLREVSDIKWSFKELYQEPEELQALADLLRPLSSRPSREHPCQLSRLSVGCADNEFLQMNPATFHPVAHEGAKLTRL